MTSKLTRERLPPHMRMKNETLHHPQTDCRITAGILDCCCISRLLYREVNHAVERYSGCMRRG